MEKLESVQSKRLDDPVKNDDLSQKLHNIQVMEKPKPQILPPTPIKQQQILQPFNSTPIKPVKNNNNNGNFPTSFASSNNFTDFQTASNSSNTPILNNLMQSQQHNSSSNSSDLL